MNNGSINVRFVRGRIHCWFLSLVLVLMSIGCTELLGQESVRLAIISKEDVTRPAADVLAAELSRGTLVILEREQIQKVLVEQSRSLGGQQDYVKAGEILGADGIIILQMLQRGTNSVLNARLIAIKPGVVLDVLQTELPTKGVKEWSSLIATRFSPFWPKLKVLPKDALPISVLHLRSSLKMRDSERVEREMTSLLVARLVYERSFFALEREKLSALAWEKDLSAGQSNFWTGAYVLDGEIAENSTNSISLRLRLESPGGAISNVTIDGTKTGIAAVVDQAAKELVRLLGKPENIQSWQPVEEGKRFFAEAMSASRAGLVDEALAAAESAHALGYKEKALLYHLARLNAESALTTYFQPNEGFKVKKVRESDVNIDHAVRSLDLLHEYLELKHNSDQDWRNGIRWEGLAGSLVLTSSRIVRWAWEEGFYASHRDEVELLRERLREAVASILPRGTNLTDFDAAMAAYAPYWYDNPVEVFQCYRKALRSDYGGYIYSIAWLRHHLTEARDKPATFGSHDSALRTPWLIDWRKDGIDLDETWKNFVNGMIASTNLNEHLDGRLLDLFTAHDPATNSGAFKRAEESLWSHRQLIITNRFTFGIAEQIIYSLPLINDFSVPFFEYFLHESTLFNDGYFNTMFAWRFDGGQNPKSTENAKRIFAAMQIYKRHLWPDAPPRNHEYLDFRTYEEKLIGRYPFLATDVSSTLKARRLWTPKLEESFAPRTVGPRGIEQVLYRDNCLWAECDEQRSNAIHTIITQIDPKTMESHAVKVPLVFEPAPPGSGWDYRHTFDVDERYIFYVNFGRLLRYDRSEKKWDEMAVPEITFPLLKIIGDYVYYAFPGHARIWGYEARDGGILKINKATLQTELIASSRRKPAQTILDDTSGYKVHSIFRGPHEELFASVELAPTHEGRLLQWSTTNRSWDRVYEDCLSRWEEFIDVPFPGGTLLQPARSNDPNDAFILYNDGRKELLFASPSERSHPQRRSSSPTRWPFQPKLDRFSNYVPIMATANGTNIWVLGPRIANETARYNLHYFEAGRTNSVVMPLEFVMDPKLPIPGIHSPGLLLTPESLIICGRGDSGLWFIPLSEASASARSH